MARREVAICDFECDHIAIDQCRVCSHDMCAGHSQQRVELRLTLEPTMGHGLLREARTAAAHANLPVCEACWAFVFQRGGRKDSGDEKKDLRAFAEHYKTPVSEAVAKTIAPVQTFLKAMWSEKALTNEKD